MLKEEPHQRFESTHFSAWDGKSDIEVSVQRLSIEEALNLPSGELMVPKKHSSSGQQTVVTSNRKNSTAMSPY